MALHRLRAAVAAGLLAMAALSFCLGQALYCEPQIVTAAPAIVASAPVDPAGPLDRGINGPSIRPGRRIATETALA